MYRKPHPASFATPAVQNPLSGPFSVTVDSSPVTNDVSAETYASVTTVDVSKAAVALSRAIVRGSGYTPVMAAPAVRL